jgi:hypothetical protein
MTERTAQTVVKHHHRICRAMEWLEVLVHESDHVMHVLELALTHAHLLHG